MKNLCFSEKVAVGCMVAVTGAYVAAIAHDQFVVKKKLIAAAEGEKQLAKYTYAEVLKLAKETFESMKEEN